MPMAAIRGGDIEEALKRVVSQAEARLLRSTRPSAFALPKRWVVDGTPAWLNRCRRLGKDWENLNVKARAFLLLASIRLMVRRLCTLAMFRTGSQHKVGEVHDRGLRHDERGAEKLKWPEPT